MDEAALWVVVGAFMCMNAAICCMVRILCARCRFLRFQSLFSRVMAAAVCVSHLYAKAQSFPLAWCVWCTCRTKPRPLLWTPYRCFLTV